MHLFQQINTLLLLPLLQSLTYPTLIIAFPNPNSKPIPLPQNPYPHPHPHSRAHPPVIVYLSPPIQDKYFYVIHLTTPVNFDSIYNNNNNGNNGNGNVGSATVPVALKGEIRFQGGGGGGETDPSNGPPYYIQTANVTGGPLDADDVKCAFRITNFSSPPPPSGDGSDGVGAGRGELFPDRSAGSGAQQQQQQQYSTPPTMNTNVNMNMNGRSPAFIEVEEEEEVKKEEIEEEIYDNGNWSQLFGPSTDTDTNAMDSGPVENVFGISCMAYYRPRR